MGKRPTQIGCEILVAIVGQAATKPMLFIHVLSKEAYAEKVKVLGKKINQLKGKQASEAQKFETAFERSTGKIQGALVDVLSIIANKKQLNLVLAKSQVILVGKDIDLTDDAIKELNKVLPKVSLDK